MFGGKTYGEAKVATCPFCGRGAYTKNTQGIPVCSDHKDSTMENMQCACGRGLDLREGKWGPFFLCEKCGPINFQKAVAMKKEAAMQSQDDSPGGWKMQKPKEYNYVPSKSITGSNEGAGAAKAAIGSAWKAKRDSMWKDENGQDIYIRSDDPRYEFK